MQKLETPILPRECFGTVLMTSGLMEASCEYSDIAELLDRHMANDWGVEGEDAEANAHVVQACADGDDDPGRIFSSYKLNDVKVWIITYPRASADLQSKPDYCNTTVMLHSDY